MPPPKAKLHQKLGKVQINNEPQPSTSSNVVLTSEQEQQFQTELYWCIEQLQTALSSDKLTNRQVLDHTKALNTLMCNTAPLVKKRQVMRLSFGDYRQKMTDEEKKAKKVTLQLSPGKPSEKSQFIKKALSGDSNFTFNFPTPEKKINDEEEEVKVDVGLNGAFVKSDNTFRFNFSS